MSEDEIFKVFTLADVLKQLRGVCGRTSLLQHLSQHPEHNGVPTHHRIGRKFVFFPEDIAALKEALFKRPVPEKASRPSMPAMPSEERQFLKALELATAYKRRKAKPNRRGTPREKCSK